MKRKSASKKIAAADADPDVDLRNQHASKCSCKSQTEQYKKGFVRGKNISVKGCKLEESREMVFFQ